MIKKSESFSVTCDHCGESLITSHEGFSLFVDENDAHEYADNEGWYMEEGRDGDHDHHYCKDCHWIDDNDEMHLRMERRKPAPSTNNQREGEKVLRWVKASDKWPDPKVRVYYQINYPDGISIWGDGHLFPESNRWRDDGKYLKWLEETDAPTAQPADMATLPVNEVWDLSGIPDDQKHDFVDGMVKITAENFLKVFVMLGLKDGIESGVTNQVTGDQFILIFKKLKYPAAQAEEEPQMEDTFDVLCPFCNRPVDIDKSDSCVCGAKIEENDQPEKILPLPLEEVPKMSDELAAQADIAAIEYGKEHGTSGAPFSYDNSGDLTNAHEAGQSWMYREMQKELFSLRTQLSEAQNDRDAWKEKFEKATRP